MKLVIDHIVVAAPDLDSGARHVARLLGVEPARARIPHGHAQPRAGHGGRHVPEVIAIDPDAAAPERRAGSAGRAGHARTAARRPVLAHWAARVALPDDLSAWQARHPERIAPAIPMTRGELRWRLTVPDDGSLPAGARRARAPATACCRR